jgi:hypothetical protein
MLSPRIRMMAVKRITWSPKPGDVERPDSQADIGTLPAADSVRPVADLAKRRARIVDL